MMTRLSERALTSLSQSPLLKLYFYDGVNTLYDGVNALTHVAIED